MDEETFEEYRDALVQSELSEQTIRMYMRVALQFEQYRQGREVDKGLVLTYKQKIMERGYSVSSINLYIIAVNKYIRFLGIQNCGVKTLKVQKRRSVENVITTEDYKKLLEYSLQTGRKKYYLIMKTLALTGIRISELRFITVSVLEKGYTHVSNKGRVREIYLPDGLITDLSKYCKEENILTGAVFLGNRKTTISREAVWKMLKYLSGMAGLDEKKVHPHSFRHYFAISYMERFSNMFELADILGHSNLETTRIYTSTSVEHKRKKINELDRW